MFCGLKGRPEVHLYFSNLQPSRSWQLLAEGFGEGMATGAADINVVWGSLVRSFERHSEGERDVRVLSGFLRGVFQRDQGACNAMLDSAMDRSALRVRMPSLQVGVPFDHAKCERLLMLLDEGAIPANQFVDLLNVWVTGSPSSEQLVRLIEGLRSKGDLGARVLLRALQ